MSAAETFADQPARGARLQVHGVAIGDRVFAGVISALAVAVPLILIAIIVLLSLHAWPAFQRFGGTFLTDSTWNPVAD